MNLYAFHSDPQSLYKHNVADMEIPEVFWHKYRNYLDDSKRAELKKRESAIAKHPTYALYYAEVILKGPFKLGEPAIATDAGLSCKYARWVLKDRFLAGEEAISKNYGEDYKYYAAFGISPWNERRKAEQAAETSVDSSL